jgi:hypothetical protein
MSQGEENSNELDYVRRSALRSSRESDRPFKSGNQWGGQGMSRVIK